MIDPTTNKTIRFVDGFKIRNMLDDDFGIIHGFSDTISHYVPKFYIPKDEVWIDHTHKDEPNFLLKVENLSIPSMLTIYSEIRSYIKKELCLPPPVPDFVQARKQKEDMVIVTIEGDIVRKYLDPEFILGGHALVYDYIPPGEIWLEHKINPEEISYILLHEEVELAHMKEGKKYEIAHEYATVADKEQRRLAYGASYPGDDAYLWRGLHTDDILKQLYVN